MGLAIMVGSGASAARASFINAVIVALISGVPVWTLSLSVMIVD